MRAPPRPGRQIQCSAAYKMFGNCMRRASKLHWTWGAGRRAGGSGLWLAAPIVQCSAGRRVICKLTTETSVPDPAGTT